MKRILIGTGVLLMMVLFSSACKKSLENKYNNPELLTQRSIPNFFTGMLNNDRVRPSYWNLRTFFIPHVSVYAQTAYFDQVDAYQQDDTYSGDYWSDYYYPGNGSGPLSTYRAMQSTYNTLSETDKADQEVYMQAAKVVLYERTAKMVDLWGDIPFSEAGSLQASGTAKHPVFDDAKILYNTLIDSLNDAAVYFASVKLTSNDKIAFSKADILLNGNILQWQSFANSVRLRLLMRISNIDEIAAKTAVTTMLSNPVEYPLIDGHGSSNYNPGNTDVLLQALTSTTSSTIYKALTETASFYATDYMLNKVMLPANDPRIPVIYDKNGPIVDNVYKINKTYRAMPINYTLFQRDTAYFNYAVLDSTTFLNNTRIPGIVITAPEVNFLKAEAYERWGGGDAAGVYNAAVAQSVYFYFYLNSLNNDGDIKPALPTGAEITKFLECSSVAYSGTSVQKLAKIYTQKWVQFGFLQSDEAWAEYRRTKYPQLFFPEHQLSGFENPPSRLLYPTVETVYNPNYNAVKLKDKRDGKIFWDVK